MCDTESIVHMKNIPNHRILESEVTLSSYLANGLTKLPSPAV